MKKIYYSADEYVPTNGGVYVTSRNADGTFSFNWTFPGQITGKITETLGEGVELVGKITTETTTERQSKVTGTLRITGTDQNVFRGGIRTDRGNFDAVVIQWDTKNVLTGLKKVSQNRSLNALANEFTKKTQNYQNLLEALITDAKKAIEKAVNGKVEKGKEVFA